ncbi:MAG TPA: hypothetical protein VIS75_06930 [Chitinophagaceae bacterium]|jgi:hypothetical protein
MKKFVLFFFLFGATKTFSQDTIRIRQIDSLAKVINNSNFKIHTDSTSQDFPQVGLWMKTYLITVTDSNQLKKYVNKVYSTRLVSGVSTKATTSSSFYFDQNKLIKVEEFMIEDDEENHADWYFADDKPLHYTLKNEKSEERANFLLNIAKTMLKTIQQ